MKRILVLFSAILMTAFLSFAQDTPMSGNTSNQDTMTNSASAISGCLNGSNGQYTLTDEQSGVTYTLSSTKTDLGQHVGHKVQISGQRSSDQGAASTTNPSGTAPESTTDTQPGTSSTATGTGSPTPMFEVSDVSMISESCNASGTNPQAQTGSATGETEKATPDNMATNQQTYGNEQSAASSNTGTMNQTPASGQAGTSADALNESTQPSTSATGTRSSEMTSQAPEA
ncbi:MAG TPA: hypothetical protein VH744_11445, partial [Terriglobales bacterium]